MNNADKFLGVVFLESDFGRYEGDRVVRMEGGIGSLTGITGQGRWGCRLQIASPGEHSPWKRDLSNGRAVGHETPFQ